MDKQAKADYETQSQELRVQLKIWENDWAKSHNGTKPGRDDIKQNPDIAQKYKQYNKLRDIVAGKLPLPSADKDAQQRSQKRKQSGTSLGPPQTPSKRPKATHTPLKSQLHPSDLAGPSTVATPSTNRKLFLSPALPTSIGPTPQKDGVVLGLFDLLARTPSRSNNTSAFTATTPNTHRHPASPSTEGGNRRLARTPRSTSGQRILLFGAATTTPLHNRGGDPQGPGGEAARQTPQSGRGGVSKLQFSTPAFLRRTAAPLPRVDENGEWGIAPLRLPRKPLGRGLSNMVAGLRKIEDEALDEDEDALREMEMEMEGVAPVEKAAPVIRKPRDIPAVGRDEVEVGDSQLQDLLEAEAEEEGDFEPEPELEPEPEPEILRPEKPVLLGGFDDENLYDSSEAEQLDRGQPLRVYVKKGQKRTTRRSNMKPARVRRPVDAPGDGEDDEVVPETQFDPTKTAAAGEEDLDLLSGSDFDDAFSDDEDEGEGTKKKKAAAKAKAAKTKAAEAAKKAKAKSKGKEKEKGGEAEEKEGVVKKAVRMVKATAHGNFKRLKLRNRGPKGGPGFGSKFRRKR
ncbi:DNA replication/checkpoint protein [Lasiosphaeria hispida]|uniref:DNA replication regulator SLD2 n=1 Tax=Lasiosphaeria hispida TaxID=260671 RepID=A0AAJ0HBY3_9PEZI|nr:DNA replication/checkpoint protein [Lasiosphaeria hispida]